MMPCHSNEFGGQNGFGQEGFRNPQIKGVTNTVQPQRAGEARRPIVN